MLRINGGSERKNERKTIIYHRKIKRDISSSLKTVERKMKRLEQTEEREVKNKFRMSTDIFKIK